MKKTTILLILGLLLSTNLTFAQDTIYLDKKVEFSSDSITIETLRRSKAFPKYAREVIRVSKDSFKIEYCNYLDGKRYKSFVGESYKIQQDSILISKNEKWTFSKVNKNKFNVSQKDSNYILKGTTYSIIPFIKNGNFIYLNSYNDTLLTEYYNMGRLTHFVTTKTILKDSVYTVVDEYPKFPAKYGELSNYISQRLKFPIEFAESSIQGRVIVSTTVTKTGEIKNIEVKRGIDILLDVEAIKVIMTLPKFEPGKIKGKSVNTHFIIPVKFSLL